MGFYKSGKALLAFALVLILIGSANDCFSQSSEFPLSKETNKEILNNYDSRAKDFAAKNLNRFALERLQSYDIILDSLYLSEKTDTLEKIEHAYRTGSSSKVTTIDTLKKQISENSEQEKILEDKYWALVRKALFSFALWLTIILILLQIRKVKLRKEKSRLQTATTQLTSLEDSSKKAEGIFKLFNQLKDPLNKIFTESDKLTQIFNTTGQAVPDGWSDITVGVDRIKRMTGIESGIVHAVLTQSEIPINEKVSTDINSLCEQYLEIANRGFNIGNEPVVQVARDFEKKIQPILINPNAVGLLLLNVLSNSFQSVTEKSKSGIKNYQPKVTISTRILPRFLQIRIRDNGKGMDDATLQKAKLEFFTTHSLEDGAGLGLYYADKIISEMHKGEIKIESEKGNSTDVYIKFFI